MSEHIDTSKGWREVPPGPSRQQRLALITNGVIDKMWVREDPVPPLPTEPGAVIQWKDDAYLPQIAQLDHGDRHLGWWAPDDHGDPRWMTTEELRRRIGSDKWTLLEPRAVTVKAVVDYLHELPDYYGEDRVAREFGLAAD